MARRFSSGRNCRVRMLWRRSASLTSTTRRSLTMARHNLGKGPGCGPFLVEAGVVTLDLVEDVFEADHADARNETRIVTVPPRRVLTAQARNLLNPSLMRRRSRPERRREKKEVLQCRSVSPIRCCLSWLYSSW